MTPYIATSYVSRICDVPPLVARAALDDLVAVTPRLAERDWELRLGEPRHGRVPGLLSAGWGQRAGVVLELDRWSTKRVLVGLRHRGRAVPWWSAGYFAAAHSAAGEVVALIQEWADEPLREIVDDTRVDPFGVCREG